MKYILKALGILIGGVAAYLVLPFAILLGATLLFVICCFSFTALMGVFAWVKAPFQLACFLINPQKFIDDWNDSADAEFGLICMASTAYCVLFTWVACSPDWQMNQVMTWYYAPAQYIVTNWF